VEALDRRKQRGLPPFAILSCDNLPGNGAVSRNVVLHFASLRDESLRSWIERNVTFPNGMVDGITPVTRESDRVALRDNFDIEDAWPVVTEPFRQWVLEDHFCNGRPAWEEVGVQFTSDVAPYEKMKLRLLNAGHSALGYLGALQGLELVHQAASHSQLSHFLRQFLEDVTPLIPSLPGFDVEEYKRTLVKRFSNPAIRDQISRICSEGSAKLPKFILPSIRELVEAGKSTTRLSLVITGWLMYLVGKDEQGRNIEVLDARKPELLARIAAAGGSPAALLKDGDLFGSLSDHKEWIAEVYRLLEALQQRSVAEVLTSWR
jgi:mannitol 2-dehydrogenase